METTKKTALSEETMEAIALYFNRWNESIYTHDDQDTREMMIDKLQSAWLCIERLLMDWDDKIRAKYPNDFVKATEEVLKNQNTQKYRELKKASEDVLFVRYQIESLYELKNRKSSQLLKLRSENAKLRLGED